MKKTKRLILTLLLQFTLLVPNVALAGTVEDFGVWGVFIAQGSLDIVSPKLQNYRWGLEGQARFLDDASDFDTGIIGADLGYALAEDIAFWLGYAWVPTSPLEKESFDEHRIRQTLTWSTRLKPLTLSSRTRLEQRFLETGDDTGWRFRQLFKLAYRFPFEARFSLVGSNEIFFNLNDTDWGAENGFDQNRAFGGFGWSFDPGRRVSAVIGYLNQYIRKPSTDNRMNHILSISLLLNF